MTRGGPSRRIHRAPLQRRRGLPAQSEVRSSIRCAVDRRTSASPLDCELVGPAGSQQDGASRRPSLARQSRGVVVETAACVAKNRSRSGHKRGNRPSRSSRRDPRSCGCCPGWGRRGRRMSCDRTGAPTLLGIERHPRAASRRGRPSSRSRRAGGRSTIASPGVGASRA